MSIESDQDPQGTDTDNTPQGEEDQQAAPQGDSPESQDSTDWKAEARKWQDRARRDADRLKAVEAKVKALVSPEEVQTKEEALQSAQQKIAELELRDVRREVGAELGLPKELWDLIPGSDEAEIRDQAERLLPVVKTATPALDAKRGSMAQTPEPPQDPNALLRAIVASR